MNFNREALATCGILARPTLYADDPVDPKLGAAVTVELVHVGHQLVQLHATLPPLHEEFVYGDNLWMKIEPFQ